MSNFNPKYKLYYQGEWDESLFAKCMTIVGSRRMTDYGRRVIEKIVPQLVQAGWTIVSGFMYGVDRAVHEATLACGGRTIAVLGWGVNWQKLDDRELKLEEEIVNSGGLLVSLWEEQVPTLWTFPARDRVMAAIGHELIVIEAGVKSGSLITAEMAYKLKKPIWAVPGPITSSVSLGTNQLIADGKAKIYQYHPLGPPLKLRGGNPQEGEILDLISDQGLDVSEIARRLGRPASDIGSELTMLMLRGDVEEREGKYFVVK
ncbi:MAG: DNA-protecting protein DprA [Candidatus Amesbacteria bacterium]|nr:DNA-protecting protein DprA [Candidatus Amesbacteria bacterium]